MLKISIKELINIVNGDIKQISSIDLDTLFIDDLSTNTRISANKNSLFIALIGEKFDANDFLDKAYESGYKIAIVSKYNEKVKIIQILVNDTLEALNKLATYIRNLVNPYVISITGSSGKTSTKEMISSIFKEIYNLQEIVYTKGNLNNHIGVPITLCDININTRVAIVEQGANHIGEIFNTGKIVKPNVAILNNVHYSHLEFFKTIENVAITKNEIFKYLSDNGIKIINLDDKNILLESYSLIKDQKLITFSLNSSDANIYTKKIIESDNKINFIAIINYDKYINQEIEIQLNVIGIHNVYNALAAICTALSANISLYNIKNGLNNYRPIKGRLFSYQFNMAKIIDDSYNANYNSMLSALNVLDKQEGKKILIIADMAELGDYSVDLHEKLANEIDKYNFDQILSIGHYSKCFGNLMNARHFICIEDLILYYDSIFKNLYTNKSTTLIKASRSQSLDKIVDFLLKKYPLINKVS